MVKLKDLTLCRFGKLVALEPDHKSPSGLWYWRCRCDCGTIKVFSGGSLRSGKATHCGCSRQYTSRSGKVDGRSKTRLYRIWQGMKSRCSVASDGDYSYYGARGIQVCDAWMHSFTEFRSWAMQNGYTSQLSIDRIDVNGPYSPENCRWVTSKEQQRNKRNTVRIEFKGVTLSASEWAERLGVSVDVIHGRYRRNGTPYTSKALRDMYFKEGAH